LERRLPTLYAFVSDQFAEGNRPVSSKVVFVIDDDAEQAELLATALAHKSWKIRAFSDPIRALAAINSEGADLLIADLAMPWIDGGDVVASARVRRPSLKVILISGYPPRGEQIAKQYAVPFFAKPVDLDALRTAVAQLLNGAAVA
jgi:DNA-binding NtrC family response regulator